MSKKLTLSEFVEKARSVHGDKYDYSLCEYKTNKDKVSIVCPHHGVFEQSPNLHMKGSGCRDCGYMKLSHSGTKDTDHFIAMARRVHGDTFDYSKSIYSGRRSKIIVTCKRHGDFEITPDSHLRGSICQKCAIENRVNGSRKDFSDFLVSARSAHGEKYLYDESSFIGSKQKMAIICPEHGRFEQEAYSHMSGQGCPKCALIDAPKNKINKWSKRDFIQRMRVVHGGRYDYQKTVYRGYKKKITVTCPVHGDFESSYFNHVNGCGCPLCALNYDQPFDVYVLLSDSGLVKVGVARSVERRAKELRKYTPFGFDIAATFKAENYPHALAIERESHNRLARFHAGMTGFDGATEWFECDAGDAITIVSESKAAI